MGVTVAGEFVTIGYAGELHPGVVGAWGLPAGACAMELDADALVSAADALVPGEMTSLSSHPAVKQDVALVVDAGVPSAAVELLESVRLFDVFTGAQLGAGKKSLAYSLVFRAPDRTLTEAEASQAREAAVDKASELGAVLRSVPKPYLTRDELLAMPQADAKLKDDLVALGSVETDTVGRS